MKKLLVTAQWDDEAKVWVATSDDILGLVTEAPSLDELLDRVLAVAPELLDDNAHLVDDPGRVRDLIDVLVRPEFLPQGDLAH
jgi:hypothetical protein